MGLQIEDGAGGSAGARVTKDNMLRVYAQVESEISHTSENYEDSYVWTASKNIDATDSIIWLRNDSTSMKLIIECISVGSDVAGSWFIYSPTGTTADGDTITGVNLNISSGRPASATCRSDATGTTPAKYLFYGSNIASETIQVNFHGALILGYLDEVAVDYTTEPALAQATIFGYYHNIEK